MLGSKIITFRKRQFNFTVLMPITEANNINKNPFSSHCELKSCRFIRGKFHKQNDANLNAITWLRIPAISPCNSCDAQYLA